MTLFSFKMGCTYHLSGNFHVLLFHCVAPDKINTPQGKLFG